MKLRLFFISCILFVLSCTKEGLPGPAGTEGPAGEPGVDEGGGGSGSQIRVITFLTPTTATFSWEQPTATNTNLYFRLKWKNATNSDYKFLLPDSLTPLIDNGTLLVYAQPYDPDNGPVKWQLLAFTTTDFSDISTYSYSVEKISNRYSISMLAEMVKRAPIESIIPKTYVRLKFVIIPQTDVADLEWG
jgi:hypothetical protein